MKNIFRSVKIKWTIIFSLCVCNLSAQTADQRAENIQNGTFNIFMSADKSYYKFNSASDNNPYVYGYWWMAHSLETLADAYQRTRNVVYRDRMKSIIAGIRKYNLYSAGTYHNDYYDDLEWLGLAAFNCYNATKDPEYLDAVHQIWAEIKTGYTGGAMSWRKGCTTPCNNSIANSPAIIMAVKLYQLEGDPANLQMAKDIHAWMKANVLNAQGGIWDAPGNFDQGWQFSYNSGMFIGACLELSIVTGMQSYIDDGIKASEFMMNYRNYNGGVFFLNENGQGDGGLFKGIFAKWFTEFVRLGNLTQAQRDRYLQVINFTGNYAWYNAVNKTNFLISPDWGVLPSGTIDLSTQTSGIHLFEAVASLNKVHVYQNINYGGFYSQLTPGTYTLAQLQASGVVDNDITSLTVPPGYAVTVYENDNFTGASKKFTTNTAWLADWNDRISSLKIIDLNSSVVKAYQDVNFGGYVAGLDIGDYTLAQLQSQRILDNDITSFKMAEGFKVTVYDADNFTGASADFTASTGWIADWNDRITSLRVRANGATNLGNTTYYIQNRNSGLYLDVWGISTADGAGISQGVYNGGANQQFRFLPIGDGAYQVQPVHSGKAMDVEGISKNNGANVFQWTYFGTPNQQFIAVPTGDGYYKLVAKHSGRIVEVANASTANGANVQQWDNSNQTSGQWKLVAAAATAATARTASPNTEKIEKTVEEETTAFGLYPNPVENTLYFSSAMIGAKVSVTNPQAVEMLSQTQVDEKGLNVSALKPGLYLIILNKDGKRTVKRFIKK
jgi:predicted alpha-1,6-mannanase (GH76 family)